MSTNWVMTLACSALLASSVTAQTLPPPGRFSNFETPQTHPIDIATVDETDYVLVCNTPDNSVEIRAAASPYGLVARVPVGLGPASVRWSQDFGRFFTCNFDGDSVSVVRLVGEGADPSNPILECTTYVGDEPSDIAFNPNVYMSLPDEFTPLIIGGQAFVTLSSQSRYGDLSVTSYATGTTITVTDRPVLEAPFSGEPDTLAVKMPRQIECLSSGDIYVANLRGGSPASSGDYDVGMYRFDILGSSVVVRGGLGTTNHAFAINSAGTLMFVVGTSAQNHEGPSGSESPREHVRDIPTGFVRSYLYVVDLSSGGMSVRAEGATGTTPRSINLNRDYTLTGVQAVGSADAIVQPTGVLLIESSGSVSKVVLTGYHSDNVAILTPSSSTSGGYTIQRINLSPATGYSVCGPRGIARSALTGLLYVNGRLDNTLRVINPSTATEVGSISLANDPTPEVIRAGRQYLYSTRFSSGFVSCASCHVDGRTDGLFWNLSDSSDGPGIPDEFHDGEGANQQTVFDSPKGRMVTQTLQGLINYPLNEEFQFAATNAPYYWRGVRRGTDHTATGEPFKELTEAFDDFNEAFVKLQGLAETSTGSGKGLSDEDMRDYRLFVDTILYPPNPEQMIVTSDPEDLWLKRETQGALPSSDSALNTGSPTISSSFNGAKAGMVLFHNFPTFPLTNPKRSCVDCHNLPEGSSNTATLLFPGITLNGADNTTLQTLETAALRGIATREMWLHDDFGPTPTHVTSNTTLFHAGEPLLDITSGPSSDGGAQSINAYNVNFFKQNMPDPDDSDKEDMIEAVTEFTRKFDTGVANATGFAYTVDPTLSPLNSGMNDAVFDQLEHEVEEGNIGLGVYTRNDDDVQGYWYDVTVDPAGYRAEGSTGSVISRATLLALATGTDNTVIAQGTPLGTERRWASASGTATRIESPTLDVEDEQLLLLPMVPDTAYVDVGRLNGNLNLDIRDSTSAGDLETTIWALRQLQTSYYKHLLDEEDIDAVLHHEPPRRFRIAGYGIRPGAKLYLELCEHPFGYSQDGPEIEMDLYPVRTNGGDLVWETYAELDGLQTFALLNGGYLDTNVQNVLLRNSSATTSAGNLDPTWGIYKIRFVNEDEDGTSNPNWQALGVQVGREYSP